MLCIHVKNPEAPSSPQIIYTQLIPDECKGEFMSDLETFILLLQSHSCVYSQDKETTDYQGLLNIKYLGLLKLDLIQGINKSLSSLEDFLE